MPMSSVDLNVGLLRALAGEEARGHAAQGTWLVGALGTTFPRCRNKVVRREEEVEPGVTQRAGARGPQTEGQAHQAREQQSFP